jgi:hypothetical protein
MKVRAHARVRTRRVFFFVSYLTTLSARSLSKMRVSSTKFGNPISSAAVVVLIVRPDDVAFYHWAPRDLRYHGANRVGQTPPRGSLRASPN